MVKQVGPYASSTKIIDGANGELMKYCELKNDNMIENFITL